LDFGLGKQANQMTVLPVIERELRSRFLTAWALALAVGLLLPHLLVARMAPILEVFLYALTGLQPNRNGAPSETAGALFRVATQLVFAAVALLLLHRNLRFRRFIFVVS